MEGDTDIECRSMAGYTFAQVVLNIQTYQQEQHQQLGGGEDA